MLGDAKAIGSMVRAVNAVGMDKSYGGIDGILKTLRATAGSIEAALAASGLRATSDAEEIDR